MGGMRQEWIQPTRAAASQLDTFLRTWPPPGPVPLQTRQVSAFLSSPSGSADIIKRLFLKFRGIKSSSKESYSKDMEGAVAARHSPPSGSWLSLLHAPLPPVPAPMPECRAWRKSQTIL